MGNIKKYYSESISGGTYTYSLSDGINFYKLSSTSTLSSDITVSFSGTPEEGMVIDVFFYGNINLNGHTFTIAGNDIPQNYANDNFWIKLTYVGSSWIGILGKKSLEEYSGVKSTTLTNGGGTITLTPKLSKKTQVISGSPSLSGDWNIALSSTASEGDSFDILYNATPTLNGHSITIGGVALTDTQAESGNVFISSVYDGTSWYTNAVNKLNTVYCTEDLCTNVNRRTLSYIASFESGEQSTQTIKLYNNFKVVNISLEVIKALSNTNAGTISFGFGYCRSSSCTVSTGAVVFTVPLSSALTYSDEVSLFGTPILVNNLSTYSTYDYYNVIEIQSSKVTAGGKVRLDIEIEMI